jgi:hypothetical protein
LGIIAATLASVGVLNPAVAVGVRAMDVNYIFGPIVGALVGFGLVAFVINPVVSTKKVVVPAVATKKVEASVVEKKVAKKAPAKKSTKKSTKK